MVFQPVDKLTNRTFTGLILAQFLAGFNDQAIHAAAMFYAINRAILTEAQAISLMPILFYAPWAIFCTLAGYYADRYSKTYALVIWKWAEVGIALVILAGFFLGTNLGNPLGAWIVLGCVFLMGTHAAFFAPAKYGAMPEILQPHVLSRGNGILESTTFLAAILGTVSGGLLSFVFRNDEIWIGVILLALSLVGAVASMMIAWLPVGNPDRAFPYNLFKPLWVNLKAIFGARPLALAALGIAFFIFMVAYMRATMYMHGQTRNPPWNEFKVSLIVATVALGVGLGAPMAGYLSGGKVELGIVPLGCLGMIFATVLSALQMNHEIALIVSLVIIGFFSGFYMVPLYTLLQHRAPKTSKGDLIATSNFINVTGAIGASLLFFLLVWACQVTGITPRVDVTDGVAAGELIALEKDHHGHVEHFAIRGEDGVVRDFYSPSEGSEAGLGKGDAAFLHGLVHAEQPIDTPADGILSMFGGALQVGDRVVVSGYTLGGTPRYMLRPQGQALKPIYDNRGLPRYLFLGAALMTLSILALLHRKLPDLFVRTLFWYRGLGKFQVRASGMQHLPTKGPIVLATNCDRLDRALQMVSATDRTTTFVLLETPDSAAEGGLVRKLATANGMIALPAGTAPAWADVLPRATKALAGGNLLAVTVDPRTPAEGLDGFLADVRKDTPAPIVPVYCGPLDAAAAKPKIQVTFGEALPPDARAEDIRRRLEDMERDRHHGEVGH